MSGWFTSTVAVRGAVIASLVRHRCANADTDAVTVVAPSVYAGTFISPDSSGQHSNVSAEVSISPTPVPSAATTYLPVLGTAGAGGGFGGPAASAVASFTSTQPPQSRWSMRAIVQS